MVVLSFQQANLKHLTMNTFKGEPQEQNLLLKFSTVIVQTLHLMNLLTIV